MPNDSQDISPIFRIDVSQNASEPQIESSPDQHDQTMALMMEQLVIGQDRQNELLEEIVEQLGANQRQRGNELNNWKQANPILAKRCKAAAGAFAGANRIPAYVDF